MSVSIFVTLFVVCCGLQPAAADMADSSNCLSKSYFDNKNCSVPTTPPIISTTMNISSVNDSSSNITSYSFNFTDFPTTDMSMNTDIMNLCCYEHMCMDFSFIEDCTNCSEKCTQGCKPENASECVCFDKYKDSCDFEFSYEKCKCLPCSFPKSCYWNHKRGIYIGICIGIFVSFILLIVALFFLIRFCCRESRPLIPLSWKPEDKPEPVIKPDDLVPVVGDRQIDDFDNVYGNVNQHGEVDMISVPENQTRDLINKAGSTKRLLPDLPDDCGGYYGNVDYPQGNNNPAFESVPPPLPQPTFSSLPPPVNISKHPSVVAKEEPSPPRLPEPRPQKTKKNSGSRLPNQSSLPESEPPPVPVPNLGELLKKELASLPEARKIDDNDIFGTVEVKPLKKKSGQGKNKQTKHSPANDFGEEYEMPTLVTATSDFGGTYEVPIQAQDDFGGEYEMPNPTNTDFGGDYEIPNQNTRDFGGSYEIPNPNTRDFGGSYEIPQPTNDGGKDYGETYEIPLPSSPTGGQDQDFDNTYEPMSKNDKLNRSTVQEDYGQEYEIVTPQKQEKANNSKTKKKIPPPIQTKKPVISRKTSPQKVKHVEDSSNDYGDTYEIPISQGEQMDYGGDYEAPMNLQNQDDPDFGAIYENTRIGLLPTSPSEREPAKLPEQSSLVYDKPFPHNHPATFQGPAVTKKNYTKFYKS